MRILRVALVSTVLAVVAGGGPVHALPGPVVGSADHRYIAGSVHVEPVVDEAVGPLDCAGLLPVLPAPVDGTLGGACFDVSSFPAGADLVLTATDDLFGPAVSMFAGYDADNDGCIGCVPGADPSWETNSGRLAATVSGRTLAVFVRVVGVDGANGAHLGSVGNLHLDVFAPFTSPCLKRPAGGPALGRELDCGDHFDGTLPYPYPCIGPCQLP